MEISCNTCRYNVGGVCRYALDCSARRSMWTPKVEAIEKPDTRECCDCAFETYRETEQPCIECGINKDRYQPAGEWRQDRFLNDPVDHPTHYTAHPSGVECIQVTEHMNFCLGNAVKYLWRAGLKDENATVEDLKKAVWYINREIERIETNG